VNSVVALDFPFVQELPKREKSKVASLWDALKDARAATQQHGTLVPTSFAAQLLGISKQRLHTLMEEGRIESVMFHNKRLVSEKSLVAWAKQEHVSGRPVTARAPTLKECIAVAREK